MMLPEDDIYARERAGEVEKSPALEASDCKHEWQHFKFTGQTANYFDFGQPFGLAYYCKKCLTIKNVDYPPLIPGWAKIKKTRKKAYETND
jgi:hypothetical protein